MSSPLSESLDQLLDRFDDAWNGPTPPRIEDFTPLPNAPEYLPLLSELVKIDMERRCKRGEQLSLEEYRRRFPACGDALSNWLEQARAFAAGVAEEARKDTDDPGDLPTLDGPPMPPPTGIPSRLLGEYEIFDRLGVGGMGEVYKARHRRLDKLVALKLLPAAAQGSCESAVRFQREMKAIGALDHPNVVEAHDAGEQSGVVYLAMKLIDGVDLERLVKQRGPLPIAEACELIRQAALGLHYLHQRGLVHRDVKPSNLMRTPDGTVKVLDLGLARWHVEAEAGHGLTGTGRVMGTPDFLAPEQVENAAAADARADLYGLGGTLFYLLTGRAPFADHKSLYAKLDAHRHEPPPDVRSLRPEVPPELADLVNRLLAKNPQTRPQTAAEVAERLAPFAGVTPPNEGSTPLLPTKVWAPHQSRRPWFVATAVGLALGGMLLLFALGRIPKPPPSSASVSEIKAPEPLHIIGLDAKLTRNVNGGGIPAGLLGVDAFDAHFGDQVTLEARLTRPAYAFLIAFRPDGTSEVCFPEKEDEPPSLTDRPCYPSTPASVKAKRRYGLTEGVGLQVFALVVSSKPLPAFQAWWSRCRNCPWQKEKALPGIVYRGNGEDPLEAWNAEGPITRGKNEPALEENNPVAQLAVWLRQTPGIETVQVLGFAVLPKE